MHKKQAKVLSKQLRQVPLEQTGIATALPYGKNWVGTTNFNLKKRNYLVIHHTAQESVKQITMDVSPEIALRIIGYDTSDLESAIEAFKLHFIQKDINSVLSDGELKILDNLYKKYL